MQADDNDTKAGDTFHYCAGERSKVSFICPTLTAAAAEHRKVTTAGAAEEGSTYINLKVILG